ncbi:MAG TPA: response regulator transcription factor [Dehalococcoidia bacterium]|nr:response regulator transcription factor [Dehalococcoidia bacterium]
MSAIPTERPGAARILLADDQRLMREGLRTLLELHADLRVVGEAGDGVEAERLVELLRPDVVLMDLRMPRRDGVTATRRIGKRWPGVHVLVLTTYDDDELVFRSLEAGAAGYLLKDVGSDALAEAVRATLRGDSPLQPSVARKLLQRFRSAGGLAAGDAAQAATSSFPAETEPLTARERDVLRLLGGGATNREIAVALSLSEGTVKNYISTVLAKTGLHDRTQAALFAVRHGLA